CPIPYEPSQLSTKVTVELPLTIFLLFSLSSCIVQPLPASSLFPYTTLFRSRRSRRPRRGPPSSCATRPRGGLAGRRGSTPRRGGDRKSTRLNSSHLVISYAVFCLKKKNRLAGVPKIDQHVVDRLVGRDVEVF